VRPVPDDRVRVVLLGRPGCHLCEQAREVVAAVCAELGERFEERSVDDDPALQRAYGEMVPVTLVDGAQHDFWRVDAGRLRAALTGPRM
jgi:Glutaredoxin-like domain (DUF836)